MPQRFKTQIYSHEKAISSTGGTFSQWFSSKGDQRYEPVHRRDKSEADGNPTLGHSYRFLLLIDRLRRLGSSQ